MRCVWSRGYRVIGQIDLLTPWVDTLWRVEWYGQNVKGPFLVSYLNLCSCFWHMAMAQWIFLVLNWKGRRRFSLLWSSRGRPVGNICWSLWPLCCHWMGCTRECGGHGQGFSWLDLGACHFALTLRTSADSPELGPRVSLGATEARGLTPFWFGTLINLASFDWVPSFIICWAMRPQQRLGLRWSWHSRTLAQVVPWPIQEGRKWTHHPGIGSRCTFEALTKRGLYWF